MVKPLSEVVDNYGHTAPTERCDCGHDFDDEYINWHSSSCPAYAPTAALVEANWARARAQPEDD